MKKLNVIDIFIILFVVLTLVGVGVRMAANIQLNEKNNTEYLITVKISSVDFAKENAIAVDDEVYIMGESEVLGRIRSVEVKKYLPDTSSENDTAVMDNDKCDLICEIAVRGSQSDKGFILESGEYIYAGMTMEIKSTGYEGTSIVMSISDKNQ